MNVGSDWQGRRWRGHEEGHGEPCSAEAGSQGPDAGVCTGRRHFSPSVFCILRGREKAFPDIRGGSIRKEEGHGALRAWEMVGRLWRAWMDGSRWVAHWSLFSASSSTFCFRNCPFPTSISVVWWNRLLQRRVLALLRPMWHKELPLFPVFRGRGARLRMQTAVAMSIHGGTRREGGGAGSPGGTHAR